MLNFKFSVPTLQPDSLSNYEGDSFWPLSLFCSDVGTQTPVLTDRRVDRGSTLLLYGLDEADEGRGSHFRWCELLAEVRHEFS